MQEPSPWEHDNALTLYANHSVKGPYMVEYDHLEVRAWMSVCVCVCAGVRTFGYV